MKIGLAKECIQFAVNQLQKNDAHLARVRAGEMTTNHRLARYIEDYLRSNPAFEGVSVDVEYDRLGADPKEINPIEFCQRLKDPNEDLSNDKAYRVRPDIIIHLRTTPETTIDNKLVVEVKKSSGSISQFEWVFCKLQQFTTNSRYKYKLGLCLTFRETDEGFDGFEFAWVENGEIRWESDGRKFDAEFKDRITAILGSPSGIGGASAR